MLQAPPCERQEPEAHLIGPVEVLEDQDGGLSKGHSLQELSHGLEVNESWSEDDRVRDWIEDFLAAQRTVGRTASPSSSTAIA